MRIPIALLACAVTAGCLPPKTYSSPSGKPEVEFPGGTKSQVKDALVASMLNAGYSVKGGTDYTLIFEAPTSGIVRLLAASQYDGQSMYRVTYTLVDGSRGVRVQAIVATVTNPGSAFERVMDITNGNAGEPVIRAAAWSKKSVFLVPTSRNHRPLDQRVASSLVSPRRGWWKPLVFRRSHGPCNLGA